MSETHAAIAALLVGTLTIRLAGATLGQRLPTEGGWARALNALPGCLILSLVIVMLLNGGPREWFAAALALATAAVTKSLPATMAVGVAAVALLRHFV
ncbi:MAG: AzlD domain-containing protein [Pseudomonadota bacterium]|nr:AzlD domain-containing protein [Pseudomonadota bacterium]